MPFIILGIILLGVAISAGLLWYLDHCSHQWVMTHRYEVNKISVPGRFLPMEGVYTVYRCSKCKKEKAMVVCAPHTVVTLDPEVSKAFFNLPPNVSEE